MMETQQEHKAEEKIIRLVSTDIEGGMSVYAGLTKIKGISWGVANAICNILKMDKKRKIGDLSKDEILKIETFVKTLNVPEYLKNRRKDFDTGEDKHLTTSDLELRKDFDVKRLKKIRTYRGFRHSAGLPLRGQRTKGNFRKNKAKGVGIKKKGKKKTIEVKK